MSNENLQKWALIAEIFGGLAIVVSLIFVGVQVNQSSIATDQNTKALESEAYQDLVSQISDMNMLIIQDPQLADIYNRMIRGEATQSPTEYRRVNMFILMSIRHGDIAYRQYANGFIDEDGLISILNPLVTFLKLMAVGKSTWEGMRGNLNTDYVKFVDKLVEEY